MRDLSQDGPNLVKLAYIWMDAAKAIVDGGARVPPSLAVITQSGDLAIATMVVAPKTAEARAEVIQKMMDEHKADAYMYFADGYSRDETSGRETEALLARIETRWGYARTVTCRYTRAPLRFATPEEKDFPPRTTFPPLPKELLH